MKWMRKVLPALILCLAACAGNNATSRVIKPDVNKVNDLAFLRQAGVNVDSIAAAEKAGQPLWLSRPQYEVLVKSLGTDYEEDMGDTGILAVHPVGDDHAVVLYRQTNGTGGRLLIATYDHDGRPCDAMNFEDKNVWPVNPETFEGGLVREYNRTLQFAGNNHFAIHSVLREGVLDHMDNEHWAVRWHQDYDINPDGIFIFKEIKEDGRSGSVTDVDAIVLANMRLTSMGVQSRVDSGVMDAWNRFVPDSEQEYGGRAKALEMGYIRMELSGWFELNPQRFLRWMAAHRGADNHLLPHFKADGVFLDVNKVKAQIDSLPHAGDRAWLHDMVAGRECPPGGL